MSTTARDVDVELSINDRPFLECSSNLNFPDGEIFTVPFEGSVHAWERFS